MKKMKKKVLLTKQIMMGRFLLIKEVNNQLYSYNTVTFRDVIINDFKISGG
jgi:hypothetical protein